MRAGFVLVRDLLKPSFEHIQRMFERQALVTGVPTGFSDLDELTAGFQNSDLVIVAGRPGAGKSALALNFAENAAIPTGKHERVPVAVFSLEMSKEQLAQRLLCSQGGINLHRVRSGRLDERGLAAAHHRRRAAQRRAHPDRRLAVRRP